jgi:predicted TIM-barrel fold metal-dependent hydrolase
MKLLSVGIISFLSVLAVNNVAEAGSQKGIVDMHCHIACLDAKNGCFIADELKDNFRFPIYIRAMGTSLDELKVQGDEVIVKRLNQQIEQSSQVSAAVILAMDGVVTRGELDKSKTLVYVPNAYVAKQAKQYPHLLFGASINPYRHDALDRLEQAKKDGAVLIKWLPSIMNIDPADKMLIPFYQKMIELGLPLLTHTGDEHSFTSADNRLGDPRKLELPAKLGVKVIAAHIATTGESGGVSNFELLIPMMQKYPNLYADISSLTQINKLGYLKQAMQVEGLDKQLVYGTDWPLQFFPITSPWYFPTDLSIKQMWQLSRQDNQWDRDVLLKKALGVPDEVFQRSAKLLNIE